MKIKKKIVIPALMVSVIICAGAYGMANASDRNNSRMSIVERISQTFNINKKDVEKVFNQYRVERQFERRDELVNRLEQLVKDGKITENQKNIFLSKMDEIRKDERNMRDLSHEERMEKRKDHQDEIHEWIEENGIDPSVIRKFSKSKGFRHR